MKFLGPGSNFELLFDAETAVSGSGLPAELAQIFGGDWVIPDSRKPYSYSNFVMSHDGRVSFNVAGHEGGGDVSDFNAHDQWLMALTRSRADAVVVGANTLRTEFEHEWTAEYIFPSEAEAFAEFRRLEERAARPIQVIVTRSGEVRSNAAIFGDPNHRVLIATTGVGAARLRAESIGNAQILEVGDEDVDLANLYRKLHADFSVQTVLCEGGPRLYASLIQAGQLDEEFLTLSPVVIGTNSDEPRPGLIEGLALSPGNTYRARPIALRRAGDHLFLRSSWR
ncbi:MAG: hypothetical protein RL198_1008 [Actinomycetota bacterium]|jgi:5-amino-6-(5-phosphoribosylamino)uracil reductase